jgi:hypothetical protein
VTETQPVAVGGKFVVLKDDKLIEGAVTVNGDVVLVRQGALDRPFTKSQVQFVAASRDEVHKFMLAKVSADDPAARLKVARWCMFSGLREQALTEAREVQKIQPMNKAAAELIRSLELSLQQFPPEGAARMTAPAAPTFPADLATVPAPAKPAAPVDPEPDVSPEAALVFGARVQPFLANQCTECHAKPDHPGAFKLVRVNPTDAGPQATRTNLRAAAAQLRKDDPGASPLLQKSLSAHGGQKLPAVASRHAVVYQSLEAWTALAVGTPLAAQPWAPVAQPVAPVVPAAPAVPGPAVAPSADPVLPPPARAVPPTVDPAPVPQTPAPVSAAPVPVPVPPPVTEMPLPPVVPLAPAPQPVVPPIPPADPLVPILPPAPPPASKTTPVPPVPPIPPAVIPAVPPIPPAAVAPLPPLPPVVPVGGSQFGTTVPPKPPVTGPAGGDEFDPAGFNRPK